jgi:hypothetical protein
MPATTTIAAPLIGMLRAAGSESYSATNLSTTPTGETAGFPDLVSSGTRTEPPPARQLYEVEREQDEEQARHLYHRG